MSPTRAIRLTVMQEGGRLTPFVSAGAGTPLLLLWDQKDAAFMRALPILATAFRVIAPQIPVQGEHHEQLPAFAEGAGLVGLQVLASAEYADEVMALARDAWGDVVRCATIIAHDEDLEAAARLMCRIPEASRGSDRDHH